VLHGQGFGEEGPLRGPGVAMMVSSVCMAKS